MLIPSTPHLRKEFGGNLHLILVEDASVVFARTVRICCRSSDSRGLGCQISHRVALFKVGFHERRSWVVVGDGS